jgi:hypothetical protein
MPELYSVIDGKRDDTALHEEILAGVPDGFVPPATIAFGRELGLTDDELKALYGSLDKFNPFHDELGRFSTGDGGGNTISADIPEATGGGGGLPNNVVFGPRDWQKDNLYDTGKKGHPADPGAFVGAVRQAKDMPGSLSEGLDADTWIATADDARGLGTFATRPEAVDAVLSAYRDKAAAPPEPEPERVASGASLKELSSVKGNPGDEPSLTEKERSVHEARPDYQDPEANDGLGMNLHPELYAEMNVIMRENLSDADLRDTYDHGPQKIADFRDAIKSVQGGMKPLAEDTVVYRGISGSKKGVDGEEVAANLFKLPIGTELPMTGLTSTSTSAVHGAHFMGDAKSDNGVMVRMLLPKGTPALVTNSVEGEIILPPGKATVTNAYKARNGRWYYDLTVK